MKRGMMGFRNLTRRERSAIGKLVGEKILFAKIFSVLGNVYFPFIILPGNHVGNIFRQTLRLADKIVGEGIINNSKPYKQYRFIGKGFRRTIKTPAGKKFVIKILWNSGVAEFFCHHMKKNTESGELWKSAYFCYEIENHAVGDLIRAANNNLEFGRLEP